MVVLVLANADLVGSLHLSQLLALENIRVVYSHEKPTASYRSSGLRMNGSEPGSLDPLDGGYDSLLLGFQNSIGGADAGSCSSGARDSKIGISDITILDDAGYADNGGATAIVVGGGTVSDLGSMPRVRLDGVGRSGITRRRRSQMQPHVYVQRTVGEGRPAYSLIGHGFEEMDLLFS